MAARRQPAPAAAPAGLKIKLKSGGGTKPVKGSPPQESGDDIGADPGDGGGLGIKENMLKRKRPSPPSSPPSKRPPREESPLPLPSAANGEPVEVVFSGSDSLDVDDDIVKQEGTPLQAAEQGVHVGADNKDDEEGKKGTPILETNISQGHISQGNNSVATPDEHGVTTDAKLPESDDQKQLVAASSSLATPSPRTQDDAEKLHTIPSHAGWFSWTKIHTLEKRGLPEFFNGRVPGKTPELYLQYRNVIIKKYREDLGKTITAADVQEQLSESDEKAIGRIVEFLDHWGIINYQAPSEYVSLWRGPPPVPEADMASMLQALPQKGSSLYHFNTSNAPVPKQNSVTPRIIDPVISEMLAFPEGPEVEYHCNSCAADCSKQRYHCQKQADFDLCPNCYEDEQFGPDMVSTDFMRMDVTEAANANGGGWTDQETLLLLEALELYGDNWNEIAEHVATKSKSQCILHFIRLPVEDPFLEDLETPGPSTSSAPISTTPPQIDSTPQGEQKGEEITDKAPESSVANEPSTHSGLESPNGVVSLPPSLVAFADAGNPVMAQVAFLAAMVGPEVASAVAAEALTAITKKDPGLRLAASTAILLEEPPATEMPPPSAPQPDRLDQTDGEVQTSGGEATQPGSGEPCSSGGITVPPVSADSNSSAPKDEAVLLKPDSNLGKEVVPKAEVDGKLSLLEESVSAGYVKQAAASAMAAAAVKAKFLADQEERDMQRLVTIVIENQLKKLELKLKIFNELESLIGKECETIERARQKIFADHSHPVVATATATTTTTTTATVTATAIATATTMHLETSSSPNPPPTTILPAEQQQMAAAAAAAAAQMAQRPPGANNFVYGPNNPNSGFYPLGASSSSGLPPNSAPLPTGLQGFGRPVAPGPMLTPPIQGLGQGQQPQPGRQQMMVGATHSQMPGLRMLGRPVMHQVASPSPSQVLGRPMSPFPTAPGQGLGRQPPLPLPSGMSRPVPGGIPDGVPQ